MSEFRIFCTGGLFGFIFCMAGINLFDDPNPVASLALAMAFFGFGAVVMFGRWAKR